MLFSEIYSAYYNAVAKILKCATENRLTESEMKKICDEDAFSESFLAIIPALKEEKWQLLNNDCSTNISNPPTQPLSLLQWRWLKAITSDRRFGLFDISIDIPEGITPLFTPDDIAVFDKYGDGDPYEDERYIVNFRKLLSAVNQRRVVEIAYNSAKGDFHRIKCKPIRLEYSEKDDKFRLINCGNGKITALNLVGIERVTLTEEFFTAEEQLPQDETRCIEAELIDERNALERAMLHFAHYERETSRISENKYRLKISYSRSDETELIIRVLSFGPMMRVLSPQSFVNGIKERLSIQKSRGIK